MITHIKKGKLILKQAEESDIEYLAANLRQGDINEIKASNGLAPKEALKFGILNSQFCSVAIHDGTPCAIFGLVRTGEKEGCIWMLGTDYLDKIKVCFSRTSKWMIKIFLGNYPMLYNYVHVENSKAIELLTWLGAKFEIEAPYGAEGRMFHKFSIERVS